MPDDDTEDREAEELLREDEEAHARLVARRLPVAVACRVAFVLLCVTQPAAVLWSNDWRGWSVAVAAFLLTAPVIALHFWSIGYSGEGDDPPG